MYVYVKMIQSYNLLYSRWPRFMINWSAGEESIILTYDQGYVNTTVLSKLVNFFNTVFFLRPKSSNLLFDLLIAIIMRRVTVNI